MPTPAPSSLSARCSGCGHELWKLRGGQWTLQQRILKIDDAGAVIARCPECAADVPVPFLQLAEQARAADKPAPSMPAVRGRMVVRSRIG